MTLKRWLLTWLLVPAAVAAPKKGGNDWAVSGAPYRVALQAGAAPGIPATGWEIRVPDFGVGRPDSADVVLIGADRKEIALDPVWRGPGRTLLLLAESMPAEGAAAMLYFGGNSSRRLRTFAAERSLLLETRRMPPGAKIATFNGWQEAWKRSKAVDGAAFVPLIFHGENPYGESNHFLSRYTGLVKTGDGGELKFYTLSDDVSYVMIDGQPLLKWQQNQPPPLDPRAVPVAKITVPKEQVKVEYCHAAVDPPGAMVLGWEQGGKLGNVPPESWIHPGTTKAGAFESSDGTPVPAGAVVAENYLGYGDQWYVRIKCAIADPGAGWQVEWLWPDGKVSAGPEIRRLWFGLEPVSLRLRLRKDARVIEGRQVLVIPRDLPAASVNNKGQLDEFLGLLDKEDPTQLVEPARKAGFIIASDFLASSTAVKWAEAWLLVAKPGGGPWVAALTLAIRETAKRDPKAALARLDGLAPEARAALGSAGNLLELDLRVFGLKDPLVAGLAVKLAKSGDKALASMAQIRLGDYHLLNGRVDEAARCFAAATPKAAERQAPVIDRAHSLAIEDLLKEHHLTEARAKLEVWERQRPAARMEGDQLLWRARVSFLAEDWGRSLQDLETSLKIRPGAPEEIDVRFWQGRALYELGRKDEAKEIWNQLIKDYPKHERAETAKLWAEKS
jgi:tetratricopeptide (TPR) repeat protein